jgi:hypothetical protein
MVMPWKHFVLVKDIVRIIFEALNPIWLHGMWDSDENTRREMIHIIYLVYVIKTRS